MRQYTYFVHYVTTNTGTRLSLVEVVRAFNEQDARTICRGRMCEQRGWRIRITKVICED